jgi:hypothetical protein
MELSDGYGCIRVSFATVAGARTKPGRGTVLAIYRGAGVPHNNAPHWVVLNLELHGATPRHRPPSGALRKHDRDRFAVSGQDPVSAIWEPHTLAIGMLAASIFACLPMSAISPATFRRGARQRA